MEGQTVSHYRILDRLGAGGMGVVYKARDERLERLVALKFLPAGVAAEPDVRARLMREARSASALDHPNIATVYEVAETADGRLFLAMAYCDGTTLQRRIDAGPLSVEESVAIAAQVADALTEAHRIGIVHCDIKPANVLLTSRGLVKVVDFGIARLTSHSRTTAAPAAMGTLPYMAPEQFGSNDIDERTDLWALGVVLYEMLTGRTPFEGDGLALAAAILGREPVPPSVLRPGIPSSLDLLVSAALAKEKPRRVSSAGSFASALRSYRELPAAPSRRSSRLIVLPFRMLRPDSEIEFLSFSLPDAVTASLAGLDSVQVRSSAMAMRFGDGSPDLASLAREADVDLVLRGTLLRIGLQVRVTTELVDLTSGTSLWTQKSDITLSDLFALQDALTSRIVEGLRVPLTARDQQRLGRDVPANADAFERYLRANQLAQEPATWSAARTLYEDCLRLDPRYAPAWARLGRACWLLGKYVAQDSRNNLARSGAAFQAALELNPDLAVTHHLYTPFEVDVGRAQEAMVRLLNVAARHPHDAEVFAGLVHACRYCGLLDASLAAAGLAQRIDANVQTSVVQTHFQRGDYALVGMQDAVAFPVAVGCALVAEGRSAEAIDKLAAVEASTHRLSDFAAVICAVADERVDDGLRAIDRILVSGFRAPEELYHLSRLLARLGESQRAIATLDAAVSGGFYCASAMRRDPWLASIRSHATCAVVLEEAERRHQEAVERFVRAGGDTILGKR